MSNFSPVETWLKYGLSDLYFGSINQSNDVFQYGTFFYIMAAEKHLKAVLIYEKRSQYESLPSLDEKKLKVEKIVKSYSHKFKNMVEDVGSILNREMAKELVPDEYLGFSKKELITAMYEGYMETRYPSVSSVSRHFPAKKAEGIYHDPLGSSFFTDFIELICNKCWCYLSNRGLDLTKVIQFVEERYSKNCEFDNFRTQYLALLPSKR